MLASKSTNFSLHQLPRDDNAEVDTLNNLGSSLRFPPETKISIVHIMILAIEYPTKMPEDITTHDQKASIIAVEDLDLQRPLHDPNVQDPWPNI